jgi:lysyl-tRNA synthetase class 2
VYTICKNFRNEEIDVTHNPEFTMMECYQAYADYSDIMELTEALFSTLAQDLHGSMVVRYNGARIDLTPPWRRVTMYDALREIAGIDVGNLEDGEVEEILQDCDPDNYRKLMGRRGYSRGLFIAQLFDHFCQGSLIQPTFVTDYPKETVPLCKIHRGDPDLIERFELFISGMEMANAYTELNDPVLQQRLFQEEMGRAGDGDTDAHPYDEDFLEALRYGMPPTGGLGVGIDRLVMLLTDNTSIKETILFPMMRRKYSGQ